MYKSTKRIQTNWTGPALYIMRNEWKWNGPNR